MAGTQVGRRETRAKADGTLAQVMRDIYFPNANLNFDVQQNDPGAPKKKGGGSTGSSTETYASAVYRDNGPPDSPARCTPPPKR